jgi:hypothetical protein
VLVTSPFAFAIEALKDFRYSGIEWWAVLAELTMCLMAITSLSIGVRFLRFAWTGVKFNLGSSLRPLLLGAGLFFPGFVFSLPLTLFVGSHFSPVGERDEWMLVGLAVSGCIGLVTASVCSIMLFKKSKTRIGTRTPEYRQPAAPISQRVKSGYNIGVTNTDGTPGGFSVRLAFPSSLRSTVRE